LAAVDDNVSGAAIRYDISPSFPRTLPGQAEFTRNRGY
jgi:hypothetical protein